MKKISFLLIIFSFIFIISACYKVSTNTDTPIDDTITEPLYDTEIQVSYIKTDNLTNKSYIIVDEKPFLYLGASIRVDALMNTDGYSYEFIEKLFKKAKELGVTSVQIPIEWKDIEIDENIWDFTYLDKILHYVNKYDLKVELLWFGTNMCGDTHSYTVPDYILKDGKTYPKFDAIRTGEFWNYYGVMWYLDFNNPNLMAKEANAVSKTMDYIWEWDRTHGAKHPVIGVQILNEADIFVRWRIGNYQVQSSTSGVITASVGWEKVKDSLNNIGKAVKSSKYKVYTRTNLANSTGADNLSSGNGIYSGSEVKLPPMWAREIFELDGIDNIGDDSYKSNIIDIKGIAYMYGKNLSGNFSHFAENDGSYSNTPSLILTALSQGAGYSIYDLFTSPFYVRHGQSGVDQGIVLVDDNGVLINKNHFEETKNVIEGAKKAWSEIILTNNSDFAVFNVKDNNPIKNISQVINTSIVAINFETNTKALGFAVVRNNYITVFVTNDAKMSFNNVILGNCEYGYYLPDGSFVSEGSQELNQNTLELSKNIVYRIKIESINGHIDSNTWEYIGS